MIRQILVFSVLMAGLLPASAQKNSTKTAPKSNPVFVSAVEDTSVYMLVNKMPIFGKSKADLYSYLIKNLECPAEAFETDSFAKQGVYVHFIIEKDGSLSNVEVVRTSHPALSEEALRLVKGMPKWTPGMRNDTPVRVLYGLPIDFSARANRPLLLKPAAASFSAN